MTTSVSKSHERRLKFIQASNPGVFLPVAVTSIILCLVVLVLAHYNMGRAEYSVGKQAADRGNRVIILYEAISQGKLQLAQAIDYKGLIQSLGGNPANYDFIAVTDETGEFTYHSDEDKLFKNIRIFDTQDEEINFSDNILSFLPNSSPNGSEWGFVEIENKMLFVVHNHFTREGDSIVMQTQKTQVDTTGNNSSAQNVVNSSVSPTYHIFVGMNPQPLQDEIFQIHTTILHNSLWAISLGFLGTWVFALLFRLYVGRKRVMLASEAIESMHNEMQWLEAEIRKHEKISAMASLATGVAHEIRNPLSSIKGYATYFADQFEEGSQSYKAAQIMVAEVDRLNRVIQDLLQVSKPISLRIQNSDINKLILSTLELCKQDAKELNIHLLYEGHELFLDMDQDRIKQTLLNIFLNAIEAFKEDDYIKLMTKKAVIQVLVTQSAGFVEVSVSNNAAPIASENIKRIFDPYFTTKSQGTGFGLSIAQNIIEAHNGHLLVQSNSAHTVFTIQLPIKSAKDMA